jgi:predicted acylesterase/phospholipase RssA
MQYDMVFEGGGAKGMVFVGALQELQTRGHSPARLLGTSAGSIMATFLAAGYDVDEMAGSLVEEKDGQPIFLSFLEAPKPPSLEEIHGSAIRQLLEDVNLRLIPDGIEVKLDDALAKAFAKSRVTSRIFSFIERGGLYGGDNFLDWLKQKLNSGVYKLERGEFESGAQRQFGNMTMAEYHAATGIELSLVAADTSDTQLLILNHRTAPNCPVIYAVRMSMSVPLLWEEVVWMEEWGKYRDKDITGHTVVDGGMLSNFPIELFISNSPHVTEVMGEKTTDRFDVLGFLIDETMEVPDAPTDGESEEGGFEFGDLRSVTRIKKLIDTMTKAHDKSVIEAFEHLVIRLPAKDYGTIEFDMSDSRREALVAAGQKATKTYFNRLEAAGPGGISFGLDSAGPEDTADRIAMRILSE